MREYHFQIPPELDGQKLRTAAVHGLGISSGLFKRAKFQGSLTLDGIPAHADHTVHAGQLLIVSVPEKVLPAPEASQEPLKVLWQDEFFLIVDKPAPLPSVSSIHIPGETLENRVYSYLGQPEDFVYRPVNRLDKGTSGLLVIALDPDTQHRLQGMLHSPDFLREYLAVCDGCPPQPAGRITLPIAKDEGGTIRRVISPLGRPAVTDYQLIRRSKNGRSLLRLRLETGRTHQIRVHLAALGCPVSGDFLYGQELQELPERFALHSAFLTLRHPVTGEMLTVQSPLPQEIESLLTP